MCPHRCVFVTQHIDITKARKREPTLSDDVHGNILKGQSNFIQPKADFIYERGNLKYLGMCHHALVHPICPTPTVKHVVWDLLYQPPVLSRYLHQCSNVIVVSKVFSLPVGTVGGSENTPDVFIYQGSSTCAEQAADFGSCGFTAFWFNLELFLLQIETLIDV